MIKLILRYVIAAVMIPVGVALGVAGLIQNRLRRKRYLRKQQQIAEKSPADENAP